MLNLLRQVRLSDPKTDLFLGANVLDAFLTYYALEMGTQAEEFNGIIHAAMDTIGTGTTLLLKVILCVVILWLLRKTNKENLLVPLSAVLVVVALSNLMVMRVLGYQV